MTKFRRSSLIQVKVGNDQFAARVVDHDSDPRCDVMIVDLRNVDVAIMVPRSAIVGVDLF